MKNMLVSLVNEGRILFVRIVSLIVVSNHFSPIVKLKVTPVLRRLRSVGALKDAYHVIQ